MQSAVKATRIESITLVLEPDEFLALALCYWAHFDGNDGTGFRERMEVGLEKASKEAFGKNLSTVSKGAGSGGGMMERVNRAMAYLKLV